MTQLINCFRVCFRKVDMQSICTRAAIYSVIFGGDWSRIQDVWDVGIRTFPSGDSPGIFPGYLAYYLNVKKTC